MTTYHFNKIGVECPMCKSNIVFRSVATNIKVCGICNTAMERLEGGGVTKTLSLHVAKKNRPRGILQIGTTGNYNDASFEIIGGLHCDFNGGMRSRWTIVWADGTTGLLVESGGFYAMYTRALSDFPGRLATVKNVPAGTTQVELIRGRQFHVFDKGRCSKTFLEGEVFSMDKEGIFITTELGELNGDRLELVEYPKERFELYTIHYVKLYELSLNNLHTAEPAITLSCDHCRSQVNIRVPHQSLQVVCSNCRGLNELMADNKLSFKNKHFPAIAFDLPIGIKGTINGDHYEITGATIKTEVGDETLSWREYTLYDATTGYAFLAEYNGHWTYLKEVKINCAWPAYKTEIYFDQERFVLFNNYSFSVKSAAGEFFTSLKSVDITAREYISPPEMYAAEKEGDDNITWYKAAHITNTQVFEGFGLVDKSMPYQQGVGPLQPMKFYMNLGLLMRMCGIIGLLFFGAQVFFEFTARQEVVYQNTFDIPDSLVSKGIISPSFQLKPATSNVEYLISAPVDNNWLETGVTLVNEKDGTEYSFEKGVEYYHGYSDGESWSEGSRDGSVVLSSIPAGTYHLNIFPAIPAGQANATFSVSLVSDVPMWRNFFIFLVMVAIYPLVVWWRTQTFEKKRWNNSAYNPYIKNEE